MLDQLREVFADSAWMEAALAFGLRLLAALILLWVGVRLAHVAARGIERLAGRAGLDRMLAGFFRRAVKVLLIVVVGIAVLDMVGIPVTSLLAVLAAAGLAVGLALRDSLSNIAGAVMLITLRPFKVGDFVDAGGVSGTVERVDIFHTTLRTADNRVISVPNRSVANGNIINFTARDQRRIDLSIGISYADDIATAKEIIASVLAAEPRVLEDPAPVILVNDLRDSAVELVVRPWVATSEFWPTRSDLIEAIKTRLEAGGCSIPFPQRDVHLYNVEGKAA
ncbi:MAG TPA: mechanosensitive ion channel [Xanthomonadaceae bacterium]|nr:mechanosensitive ion channel [Xanthomonadaceae bacterium]